MIPLLLRSPSRVFAYFFQPPRGSMHTAEADIPKSVFLQALSAFNDTLAAYDERMTFLCVGGGAVMLAHGNRNATHDLDGVLADDSQTDLFYSVAQQVAYEFREDGTFALKDDWINLQVGHFMRSYGYQESFFEEQPGFHWSHLRILFAKPGYLLAMKAQASRLGKHDFNDIVSLLRLTGIKTLDGLQETCKEFTNMPVPKDKEANLCLAIAWAFPGQTEYDSHRLQALEKYKAMKGQQG